MEQRYTELDLEALAVDFGLHRIIMEASSPSLTTNLLLLSLPLPEKVHTY